MLLELDPVSIFPISSHPVIEQTSSDYSELDQFPSDPDQKCVSLRPEEVIPKAKAMFKNCLLLEEKIAMLCFVSELDCE